MPISTSVMVILMSEELVASIISFCATLSNSGSISEVDGSSKVLQRALSPRVPTAKNAAIEIK